MARIIVAQAEGEQPVELESVGGDHSLPEDAVLHEEIHAYGDEHHTSVFPPFDASTFPSQLLWLAITFGLLYIVMQRVALPRIGSILEERRDRIDGDIAEAERLQQKTDAAIESYETALAEARKNAHGIAEETRGKIRAELDGKRKAVEEDLGRKVADAEGRIAQSKAAALEHVDEIAADIAQTVVAQLAGTVTAKDARDAVAKVGKE
ncbi:F0F1 ATP synthase subunit B [Pelagibacterium limicola]|uniref:F0F1 ATP synthase subunit B n=1 Tax=Pelagibacterium limicola TaxID=2791022 RepID=UPI0018AF9448|nr:F0F1 ATP synthase subunit B [Pelagibacterium limicola]